ncbi:hypothetical protein CDD83_6876 [Cordyceps sp. RAO-2017]|nr:hypothetical protein CDD83_6876 [Cordyceps sp. RAO-2017]
MIRSAPPPLRGGLAIWFISPAACHFISPFLPFPLITASLSLFSPELTFILHGRTYIQYLPPPFSPSGPFFSSFSNLPPCRPAVRPACRRRRRHPQLGLFLCQRLALRSQPVSPRGTAGFPVVFCHRRRHPFRLACSPPPDVWCAVSRQEAETRPLSPKRSPSPSLDLSPKIVRPQHRRVLVALASHVTRTPQPRSPTRPRKPTLPTAVHCIMRL